MSTGRIVVGVTGASGAIYARRYLMQAARRFETVYLTLSAQAVQVAETELGVTPVVDGMCAQSWLEDAASKITVLNEKDYFTPPASGSFIHDGMVIVPCSMGTVGRIANGISNDLLTRSADVCLKEGRKLILVPREMPWNLIMLRNLTQLAESGATILPACPAWYHKPQSLEDLADTVVARILQQIGVEQDLVKPWMAEKE
jgi:4-hydroxy-3-polyprenylbenzoate decarboxylase